MKKSFTLIELLVVIAIIGLLVIIIAIPINRARQGASIARILQYEASLHRYLGADIVGWWQFNEGEGIVVYDISGHNNHGTLVNNPQWVDGVPGKEGYALNFNGSAKRVTISNPFGQDGFTTLSLWYKRDENSASGNWRTLIGHITANIHHLISHSSTRNLGIWDGSWSDFGFNPPNDGKWYHCTVIYNSGINATLYVNGVYQNQILTSLNLLTNPIGSIGNWGGDNYWAGPIDDVRTYSRALTSKEIQTIYAETKDKYLVEK